MAIQSTVEYNGHAKKEVNNALAGEFHEKPAGSGKWVEVAKVTLGSNEKRYPDVTVEYTNNTKKTYGYHDVVNVKGHAEPTAAPTTVER